MSSLFTDLARTQIARGVADAYGLEHQHALLMVRDVLTRGERSEHVERVAPFLWAQLEPQIAVVRSGYTCVEHAAGQAAEAVMPRAVARHEWSGTVLAEHADLRRLDEFLDEYYGPL